MASVRNVFENLSVRKEELAAFLDAQKAKPYVPPRPWCAQRRQQLHYRLDPFLEGYQEDVILNVPIPAWLADAYRQGYTRLRSIRKCEPFADWFDSYAVFVPVDYPIRGLNAFHQSIRMQTSRKIAAMVRREVPMKVNFTYYIKLEREVHGRLQVIDHYFRPVEPLLILEPSVADVKVKLDERINWIQ